MMCPLKPVNALAAAAVLWTGMACRTPKSLDPAGEDLVVLFPGIQGSPAMLAPARRAFRDAGVDGRIETHDWRRTQPFGAMQNLTNEQHNRRSAVEIAEDLAAYSAANPGHSIDLVGYSGGGGLAMMVAEALGPRVRLRHVILVHAAVSCDYPLDNVLRKLDGKLVNFYSHLDWIILGMGTSVFGTMDRTFAPAAGKNGFDLQQAVADPQYRERVEQHSWSPRMLATGHYGGHSGMFLYRWNLRYVAPYLVLDP